MNGKPAFRVAFLLGLVAVLLVFASRMLRNPSPPSHGGGGHEHGVAHLNLAVEGTDLHLEFISPSANLVGFEHSPRTEAQRTAVSDAIEILGKGESLLVSSAHAQCMLAEFVVDTDIGGGPGTESEDGHAHEHDETSKPPSHSEFSAEYHFVCERPEELTGIDVMFFDRFPGIEHIEVRLLTATGQAAQGLSARDNRISF